MQDFHWINSPDNVTWRMHEGEFTLPEEGKRATGSIQALWVYQSARGSRHPCNLHIGYACNEFATVRLMGCPLCVRLQHVHCLKSTNLMPTPQLLRNTCACVHMYSRHAPSAPCVLSHQTMLRLAIRAGWVNFPVKDVIEARKMSGVYDLNSVPDGQACPSRKL